jgi:hypothetical protein
MAVLVLPAARVCEVPRSRKRLARRRAMDVHEALSATLDLGPWTLDDCLLT